MAGAPVDASKLRVASREITGAGSYTTFATADVAPDVWRDRVGLDVLIEIPGVPNGLGAVLWLNNDCRYALRYTRTAETHGMVHSKVTASNELPNNSLERTRER